ncbi:glutathione S-transferase family protein [Beijerinckia sp. L45]|uniref:glutathione S-transferase family protein n=1 Tax=Beijerinckia sp. L45 TaxID=1641855 RepID=UPI00131CA1AC|nr:glutathione S-transferase family protein [Beijerinckia sp. L45]
MMQLYWAPRTRSLRALWILEEAGVPYERIRLDMATGAHRTPAFKAINPMAKVPALRDGDVCVAESAAICAYVAERVPAAGLEPPRGDPKRGRYLQWLAFAAGCVEAAFMHKFQNLTVSEVSAGYGSFDKTMAVLDEALRDGPWILGGSFSAADVMLGCDLFLGVHVFKIVEPTPAFSAYLERCLSRPAFQRAQAIDAAAT